MPNLLIPFRYGGPCISGVELAEDAVAPDGSEPALGAWYVARTSRFVADDRIAAGPFASEDEARGWLAARG